MAISLTKTVKRIKTHIKQNILVIQIANAI